MYQARRFRGSGTEAGHGSPSFLLPPPPGIYRNVPLDIKVKESDPR